MPAVRAASQQNGVAAGAELRRLRISGGAFGAEHRASGAKASLRGARGSRGTLGEADVEGNRVAGEKFRRDPLSWDGTALATNGEASRAALAGMKQLAQKGNPTGQRGPKDVSHERGAAVGCLRLLPFLRDHRGDVFQKVHSALLAPAAFALRVGTCRADVEQRGMAARAEPRAVQRLSSAFRAFHRLNLTEEMRRGDTGSPYRCAQRVNRRERAGG